MRMLEEHVSEFTTVDQMDATLAKNPPVDEKTYQFICFALSTKGRSKPCILKHVKGALDAGTTMTELNWIFALTMREAAGADDCWTHDVIGNIEDINLGNTKCDCPK